MKDFFYYLKKGELRIPTCTACHRKVWPPTFFCNMCYISEIEMVKADPKGIILEHTQSDFVELGAENIYALIDIGGIRLIGSVVGGLVSVNKSVLLKRCGIRNNLCPFYEFSIVDNHDQS